jgi:hypothetical protein
VSLMRISNRIAFPTSEISYPASTAAAPVAKSVRRRLTPEAGRAMEKLSHAIEYLSGEFVNGAANGNRNDDRLEAIENLMALNRQIYVESPEFVSLGRRLSTWIRRVA